MSRTPGVPAKNLPAGAAVAEVVVVRRRLRAALFAALPLLASLARSDESAAPKPRARLATGITGLLTSSGLENPEFLLSFVPVQNAVLGAAASPLDEGALKADLAGTPVKSEDLLRAGLLCREDGGYRLNYLVLTVGDQKRIDAVARLFGADLARTFLSRRAEFDRILSDTVPAERRRELLFGLVTGMVLNWDGLALTSELGYRVRPRRLPNGDAYLVHSSEIGARLDTQGLYWGSHSFPGTPMTFSTFGDSDSLPRLRGIPDVFFGPAEEGLESLKDAPDAYEATRGELIAYIGVAIDDAGAVLAAVAQGARTEDAIAERTHLPRRRWEATLRLLQGTGYVVSRADGLHEGVVVLTERDRPRVDRVRELGKRILAEWLQKYHGALEGELRDLSPMRSGLPFELVFSEVWHYVFGYASKTLAEEGFTIDPRASGYRYDGYVPLVFASSLHAI